MSRATLFRRASGLTLASAMAVLLVAGSASTVVAGGSITCTYYSDSGRVRVRLTGDTSVTISRTAAGRILVEGDPCGGLLRPAHVENTDIVEIFSGAGQQTVTLDLANGGFRPGRTNEAGSSDEVEFKILMGSEFDVLVLAGASTGDDIALGATGGSFGTVRRINLNAAEATGVDYDVTLNFDERTKVLAGSGSDMVSGGGGSGTGAAFDHELRLYGGPEGDVLEGGTAADRLYGEGGADSLWTVDGVHGNDIADGGPGIDTCTVDNGDSKISC